MIHRTRCIIIVACNLNVDYSKVNKMLKKMKGTETELNRDNLFSYLVMSLSSNIQAFYPLLRLNI